MELRLSDTPVVLPDVNGDHFGDTRAGAQNLACENDLNVALFPTLGKPRQYLGEMHRIRNELARRLTSILSNAARLQEGESGAGVQHSRDQRIIDSSPSIWLQVGQAPGLLGRK